jgi:hypothetical protein
MAFLKRHGFYKNESAGLHIIQIMPNLCRLRWEIIWAINEFVVNEVWPFFFRIVGGFTLLGIVLRLQRFEKTAVGCYALAVMQRASCSFSSATGSYSSE